MKYFAKKYYFSSFSNSNLNKINFVEKKDYKSNKDLILLKQDNSVGDVVVASRLLHVLEHNSTTNHFDVLCDKKFKIFLDQFHFKNINIFYCNNVDINHYNKDYSLDTIDWNKIQFIYNKLNEYNNVYTNQFFLTIQTNILLHFIKYKNCIMFKRAYYKKTNHFIFKIIPCFFTYLWCTSSNVKTPFPLKLFNVINFKKFNFKFFGNNKCKKLYIQDFIYYSIFKKIPTKSLSSLDLSNYFKINRKNIKQKSLIIMIDDARQKRRLKLQCLIDYINAYFPNYNVTFVGNGPKFMKELFNKKQECKFKIIDKVNKTKTLMDLINEVNKIENVLAYDTSILHIAMLLNKKTTLIINKKTIHYYSWCKYDNPNLSIIKLNSKYFY